MIWHDRLYKGKEMEFATFMPYVMWRQR